MLLPPLSQLQPSGSRGWPGRLRLTSSFRQIHTLVREPCVRHHQVLVIYVLREAEEWAPVDELLGSAVWPASAMRPKAMAGLLPNSWNAHFSRRALGTRSTGSGGSPWPWSTAVFS